VGSTDNCGNTIAASSRQGAHVRKRYIPFLFSALALPLANGTPAFATDGRTAVGKCIDTPGCSYHCEPNGACTISPQGTKGPIIYCGSADDQCVVVDKKGGGIKGTGIAAPPIKPGKPVEAPPPQGSKPVNAAPIVNGKPVQAAPGAGPTEENHPILERGESHSGGRH
jgi:hypothetical protein